MLHSTQHKAVLFCCTNGRVRDRPTYQLAAAGSLAAGAGADADAAGHKRSHRRVGSVGFSTWRGTKLWNTFHHREQRYTSVAFAQANFLGRTPSYDDLNCPPGLAD